MNKYSCVLLFAVLISRTVVAQQQFQVNVDFKEKIGIDSLYLFCSDSYYEDPSMHVAGRGKDNIFHFSIPSRNRRGKFYISQKTPPAHRLYGTVYTFLPFIPEYPFETGDSIKMVVTRRHPELHITESFVFDYNLNISGKGAEKSIAWQQIAAAFLKPNQGKFAIDSAGNFINPFQEKLQAAFVALEQQHPFLPAFYYELYKAQILCKLLPGALFYRIQYFWDNEVKKMDNAMRSRYAQSYFLFMDSLHSRFGPVPDTVTTTLDAYVQFLYKEAKFKVYLQTGKEDVEKVMQWIIDNYHGDLKEKLLITAFRLDSSFSEFSKFEADFENITSAENKAELKKLYAKLEGYPAYNFQLIDTSGNLVQLKDLKGKVVFIDFWFTGCGACAGIYEKVIKEAETILSNEPDIAFVSVCVDKSRANWMKSVYKDEYTSPHIMNLYTNGEGTKNNLIRYYGINAFPQFLIVDKKGKVYRFFWDLTAKELASPSSLVETLKNLAAS